MIYSSSRSRSLHLDHPATDSITRLTGRLASQIIRLGMHHHAAAEDVIPTADRNIVDGQLQMPNPLLVRREIPQVPRVPIRRARPGVRVALWVAMLSGL